MNSTRRPYKNVGNSFGYSKPSSLGNSSGGGTVVEGQRLRITTTILVKAELYLLNA
jgi:hypothetical protein